MTGAVVLAAGAVTACWLAARRPLRTSIERARKLFHLQREHLEFRFFTIAARSGKPRGLEWVDCDFEDEVSFARDRTTGRLRALVGLTIRFRAIEGGEMEDNPNADNLRAASALFHLEGSDWGTEGRAIFNLNPTEAIQHYRQELEVVE
jgi:hypothetical protein